MKNLLLNIAHTTTANGYVPPAEDLEHQVSALSFNSVLIGSGLLIALLVISALVRDRVPKLKTPLFLSIIVNTLIVTALLIGSTIYLNTKSSSGGPVHWHADFEIWACGQELELRDPTGFLSNKIGTSTYHEHDDRRIHLEGVVVEERDASLGKFFYVVDGGLTKNSLVLPLNNALQDERGTASYFEDDTDGEIDEAERAYLIDKYVDTHDDQTEKDNTFASFINGQTCGDGQQAQVQVFTYSVLRDEDGNYIERNIGGKTKTIYTQTKLDDPVNFIINSESVVPPGDCIIVEFDEPKDFTDKKCFQFEVQDEQLEEYYYQDPTTAENLGGTDA